MSEQPENRTPPKYPYRGPSPPLIRAAIPRRTPSRPKPVSGWRVLIWVTLTFVLLIRFAWFRDDHRPQWQNPVWGHQNRGDRRPPTRLYTPVAEIPQDLYRFHIEIAPDDVELLRGYHWNGWGGGGEEDRPQVKVTVREAGTVYTNVALHLKGAAGSFRRFDDKPALTLNFSKHAKGQQFHGLSKLSLNNSVQDPTFLCEAVCRELFEAAGVPAPRADFATVLINGRDLGLYVMVEGYNKDFLRRHFSNVKGNLYDGGFCQDIHRNMEVDSGEHPEDRSGIQQLLSAAREPSPSERWARLGKALDVDRFVSMLALEVLTCHWDGYSMNRNNYRLFHDLETGRMVFMPHGMDQMFSWPDGRMRTDSSIYPGVNGVISQAVLTTPEGEQLYRKRLGILHTNLLAPGKVVGRVRELAGRIRPTLAAYSPHLAQNHDQAVEYLCERINQRAQSVQFQLAAATEVLPFDENGVAHLDNWHAASSGRTRGLRMDTTEEDGTPLLEIRSTRGGTGSWRTRVLLPAGRYVFEGRARASGRAAGGRVALRISGVPMSGETVAQPGWIDLRFPFEVHQMVAEHVLVCEFSGPGGEVAFDASSLRLIRLN